MLPEEQDYIEREMMKRTERGDIRDVADWVGNYITKDRARAREALSEAEAYLDRLRRATTRDEAWGVVCSAATGQVHGLLLSALPEPIAFHAVLDESCPACIEIRRRDRDGVCSAHRIPVPGLSAEGWLAERGYADSRPHSNVEIAALLDEYARYRGLDG